MIIIAHRGLINGPNDTLENNPDTIDLAIKSGYEIELDIRYMNNIFYLGHDTPQYEISQDWLQERKEKLWIHCKNVDALLKLKQTDLHYFWHENDTLTLTSLGYIWVYPGKQPIRNSVAVLPEIYNDNVSVCFAVCTDYPERYKL